MCNIYSCLQKLTEDPSKIIHRVTNSMTKKPCDMTYGGWSIIYLLSPQQILGKVLFYITATVEAFMGLSNAKVTHKEFRGILGQWVEIEWPSVNNCSHIHVWDSGQIFYTWVCQGTRVQHCIVLFTRLWLNTHRFLARSQSCPNSQTIKTRYFMQADWKGSGFFS